MHPIDPDTPVGQIARFHPEAVELFERFDIAYAAKGARPLHAAARAAGADLDEILQELRRLPPAARHEPTAADLVEAIVAQHHRPSASALVVAAARIAGAAQSEKVRRIGRLVETIGATLHRHMEREEEELFPRICHIGAGTRIRAGSVSRALLVEFVEHDAIAEWLAKVWELALQLTRDEDPDGSLFESLSALHRALNRHMHAENNLLIPMVVEREAQAKRATHEGHTAPSAT